MMTSCHCSLNHHKLAIRTTSSTLRFKLLSIYSCCAREVHKSPTLKRRKMKKRGKKSHKQKYSLLRNSFRHISQFSIEMLFCVGDAIGTVRHSCFNSTDEKKTYIHKLLERYQLLSAENTANAYLPARLHTLRRTDLLLTAFLPFFSSFLFAFKLIWKENILFKEFFLKDCVDAMSEQLQGDYENINEDKYIKFQKFS